MNSEFYECLNGKSNKNSSDDENVLGRHLVLCHGLRSRTSFDDYYVFSIIEHCSPMNIDKNEHKWI